MKMYLTGITIDVPRPEVAHYERLGYKKVVGQAPVEAVVADGNPAKKKAKKTASDDLVKDLPKTSKKVSPKKKEGE